MTKLIIICVIILILIVLYFILINAIKLIGIKRIVYSRSFSQQNVYEGQKVYLTETIYNKSFLPLFFIDVEANIYSGLALKGYPQTEENQMQYFRSRFTLMPFMQVKRTHEINCVKRGYYTLETVDIYFARSIRYIDSSAELYVFPRPLPISDVPFPENFFQGSYFSNKWLIQDPFSLSGVRDYHSGDPFNSINFKATAKTGALRVNNRDYCSGRSMMVYINFQTESETVETKLYNNMIEKGLSYASAIIRHAVELGLKAGFCANCSLLNGDSYIRFPVKSGYFHQEAILKEMAKIRAKVGYSFKSLLDMDINENLSNIEIFILTSYVSENTERQIDIFKRTGNTVNIIMLK